MDNKIKTYAVIGFGNIAKALANAFARSHMQVSVAATGSSGRIAAQAAAIGPEIIPVTVEDAIKADILFLAVPYKAHPEVAKLLSSWEAKIIVDMTNAYGIPQTELNGQPSGKVVEKAFGKGKLVKAFNHLPAQILGQDPAVGGGRRVVFLAGDDESAVEEIGILAENLGFAPVKLGRLSEGGRLVHGSGDTWGKLIFKDLVQMN